MTGGVRFAIRPKNSSQFCGSTVTTASSAVCRLRLGEVLGLERGDFDGEALHLRGSAHAGVFTPGDQPTKRHVRTVPCPPSTAQLIRAMPARIDTPLLFPTPAGRIWHESNFRRDV